jgi:hypothetical protein
MEHYLKKLPDLRIGFDVSHWCNVAESFLQDQADAVDMAISRAEHIHARVGFPEGPQVPDPRVPEWQEALQIHLEWWRKIIKINREAERSIYYYYGVWPVSVHAHSAIFQATFNKSMGR